MRSTAVHVERLDARYTIARAQSHAAPSIRRRLDRIAAELLAPELEQRFSLFGTDDRLYFIEQLNVDCTLDIRRDDRRLSGAWARVLHEDVLGVISRGGSVVVVFRDRAEYLAAFLEDLLVGRAWERWYFDEFRHLSARSTGQITVHVLSQDADAGRDAMLELARRRSLDALLAALDDAEAESVVRSCLLPPTQSVARPGIYPHWVGALRAHSRGVAQSFVHSRDLARLYLSLLEERPELGPDATLARFIDDLLRLRRSLMQAENPRHLLSQIEAEDADALFGRFGHGSEADLLRTLMREVGGTETAGLLRDLQTGDAHAEAMRRASTAFGGLFLLCPTMLELSLDEFLERSPYPEPEGASKSAWLRFALALQCVGARNTKRARTDAGLALFAGLTRAPTPAQLNAYAQTLTPDMHRAFQREFLAHATQHARRFAYSASDGAATSESEPASFVRLLFSGSDATDEAPLARLLLVDEEDADSLSLDQPALEALEAWSAALAAVSSTMLQGFAARLGAFAESSAEYLHRNFIENRAELEFSDERLVVRFLTCPLQMVLRMAGFDHSSWLLDWQKRRELEFQFD
ncbi:MAG TPA: hypothetical protein VGB73_07755 [Pyrinomonadaceae bacterium]|jgi:hypothetical protein